VEQVEAFQAEDIENTHAEQKDWRGGQEYGHGHHLGGVYVC
jgi:hypothetical protein